jgi:hypothetical protein
MRLAELLPRRLVERAGDGVQEIGMRYETTTSLDLDEALAAAERFFSGQFGMTVRMRGDRAIGFEGGGGHVAMALAGEHPTTLELETREWDQQVTQFMRDLPR